MERLIIVGAILVAFACGFFTHKYLPPKNLSVMQYSEQLVASGEHFGASILCQYMAAKCLGIENELAKLCSEYVKIEIEKAEKVSRKAL